MAKTYRVKVIEDGNDVMIPLPIEVVRELNIREGSLIDTHMDGDSMVIRVRQDRPRQLPKPPLDKLKNYLVVEHAR